MALCMVKRSMPVAVPIRRSETKVIKLKERETGRRKHWVSRGSGQLRDSGFSLHRLEVLMPSLS